MLSATDREYPWGCWCGEQYRTARAAWLCKKCRNYLYEEDFDKRTVTNIVTGEEQTGISEALEPARPLVPPGWENAPPAALAAFAVAGDDTDLFDRIKAALKGEE